MLKFSKVLSNITCKVPLRDGVDFISRGRLKFKRTNTGVPMICTGMSYSSQYCVCRCCMLRMAGMRSDDVCLIVALGVLLLKCVGRGSISCCCAPATRIYIHRDCWPKKRELGARLQLYRCCCTAVY